MIWARRHIINTSSIYMHKPDVSKNKIYIYMHKLLLIYFLLDLYTLISLISLILRTEKYNIEWMKSPILLRPYAYDLSILES